MIYKAIILLAGIFGFYQLFKIKDRFARLIVIGQILGILLTFSRDPLNPMHFLNTIGFTLFILAGVATTYYIITNSTIEIKNKVLMSLISIPAVIILIFEINHFPFVEFLSFSMILPLLSYLFLIVFSLKKIKNEMGFLTILAADGCIHFLIVVQSWIH